MLEVRERGASGRPYSPAVHHGRGDPDTQRLIDRLGLEQHRSTEPEQRRGLNHTADDALRPYEVPLPTVEFHRPHAITLETPARLVKIPPGNSIHGRQHRGRRPQQRCEGPRALIGLVRLERTEYEVLWAERRGVIACADPRHFFAAVNQ